MSAITKKLLSEEFLSGEIISNSPEETYAIAKTLGAELSRGDVVALSGELGAGKTVFCRGIAEALGVDPGDVSSPTFAIVNEYKGSIDLLHFDFYRMSGADEARNIGWEDYLERNAVIMIEWPEIAPEILPVEHIEVKLEMTDTVSASSQRKISIHKTINPQRIS